MPLVIGIAAETTPGERRLSVVPDVVKKYLALGAEVVMQKGAGVPAHFRDEAFESVSWVDEDVDVCAAAYILLSVQPP
ncbi:MAG TPA: NAD(P)(+) transhydrogenase (Re/Si-specific) subunit alpha, partial [Denitromonas sp.]|nr:NAD(P)(+) transhydrogenase (Re/Si-specific) subunit alpha [Denitromonas sp.]